MNNLMVRPGTESQPEEGCGPAQTLGGWQEIPDQVDRCNTRE
jgi:hypothetical protein